MPIRLKLLIIICMSVYMCVELIEDRLDTYALMISVKGTWFNRDKTHLSIYMYIKKERIKKKEE